MMVLNLRREIDIEDENDAADRTGIFTTGIVSTREGCKITLFFTGRRVLVRALCREPLRSGCERQTWPTR